MSDTDSLVLRPAEERDVHGIFKLLDPYADKGIVLRRSEDDIRFYLANFRVAERNGVLCGCVAARDFGNDLLEIRSLVVDPACQGQGIGKELIRFVVRQLNEKRAHWKLFTLTCQQQFFEQLGFSVVAKEMFPEKIWSDCSKCPKQDCCDEVALLLEDH